MSIPAVLRIAGGRRRMRHSVGRRWQGKVGVVPQRRVICSTKRGCGGGSENVVGEIIHPHFCSLKPLVRRPDDVGVMGVVCTVLRPQTNAHTLQQSKTPTSPDASSPVKKRRSSSINTVNCTPYRKTSYITQPIPIPFSISTAASPIPTGHPLLLSWAVHPLPSLHTLL